MNLMTLIVPVLAFVSSTSGLCNPPNWLQYPNLSYSSASRFESGDADADSCQTVCTQNLGAEIRIYTLAGEIVKDLDHESETYRGDTRWYDDFSADNRIQSGGEHSWDLLSENGLSLAGGLYLFTVRDKDSGRVQRGKFVIIK